MPSELIMPTAEEIEQAWREIDEAGPGAQETLMLGLKTLRNPRLSEAIRRMTESYSGTMQIEPARAGIMQALVMGAVMAGLNYGLRISGARVEAAKAKSGGVS